MRKQKEKTPQLGLQPVRADSLFSPYVHLTGVGPHLISYFWSSFWSLRVPSERGRNRSAIKGSKKMGWKGGKSQVGVGWEWSEPFGERLGSSKQKLWDRVELQWGGPAYWWRGCNGLISPPGSYSWSHWRDTIKSLVCGPVTDSFWFPLPPFFFPSLHHGQETQCTSVNQRVEQKERVKKGENLGHGAESSCWPSPWLEKEAINLRKRLTLGSLCLQDSLTNGRTFKVDLPGLKLN